MSKAPVTVTEAADQVAKAETALVQSKAQQEAIVQAALEPEKSVADASELEAKSVEAANLQMQLNLEES